MYNLNNLNLSENAKIAIEWANKYIFCVKDGGSVYFPMYKGATKEEIDVIKFMVSLNPRVKTCNITEQFAAINLKEGIAQAA
jgi:hypothetical protein